MTAVSAARRSRCSGVVNSSATPRAALAEEVGELLGDPAGDLLEPVLVGRQLDGERAGLGDEVVAQPRVGGELHAVGLLVHADPAAEVVAVDAELLGDGHVGRHEHERGGAAGRQVVLPQHLARHEREQRPGLGTGDLAAEGLHGRVGSLPRFSTIASKVGSSMALIESALTPIHVARSTTSASGASSGVAAGRSRRPAARRRGARIAATSASASLRLTAGPAGTSVRPVVFANSQSTDATQRLPLLVAAGQRQPHLVSAATIRSNAARARCVPP